MKESTETFNGEENIEEASIASIWVKSLVKMELIIKKYVKSCTQRNRFGKYDKYTVKQYPRWKIPFLICCNNEKGHSNILNHILQSDLVQLIRIRLQKARKK